MNEPIQISQYKAGDPEIWIPVAKETSGAPARAFLPFNGLTAIYQYGYKADRQRGDYLTALAAIQAAYMANESSMFRLPSGKDERQYKAKWRHGTGASPPGLGPTGGWVKIPFSKLTRLSEAELVAELTSANSKFAESKMPYNSLDVLFVPIAAEVRTFQEKFRKNALKIWPPRCVLSGATVALEAAHIKPVSASRLSTDDVLDCYNSVLLNVALHRLFDQGLFSFSEDGRVIVSVSLSSENRKVYGLDKAIFVTFNPLAKKYLDFHRGHVFISEAQLAAPAALGSK